MKQANMLVDGILLENEIRERIMLSQQFRGGSCEYARSLEKAASTYNDSDLRASQLSSQHLKQLRKLAENRRSRSGKSGRGSDGR